MNSCPTVTFHFTRFVSVKKVAHLLPTALFTQKCAYHAPPIAVNNLEIVHGDAIGCIPA
jgi:hypothetical protein